MGNGRIAFQSPGGGDYNIVSSGQSSLPLGYSNFPRCCLKRSASDCQMKNITKYFYLCWRKIVTDETAAHRESQVGGA